MSMDQLIEEEARLLSGVSGFFRLAEACLIKNKVVPLQHGTYQAS